MQIMRLPQKHWHRSYRSGIYLPSLKDLDDELWELMIYLIYPRCGKRWYRNGKGISRQTKAPAAEDGASPQLDSLPAASIAAVQKVAATVDPR